MGCFHQSPATFPVGGQIPVGFTLTVLAAVVSDFRRLLSDGEWLLLVGFRISLRFPSWLRITIWFAVLFVFALLLPYLLGQIPSWLLPAQWSNLGFWPDLVNILNERLNETLSLVPTTRDVFAKRRAIEFTLWLLACLGALGLSVRVLKQR